MGVKLILFCCHFYYFVCFILPCFIGNLFNGHESDLKTRL